MSSRAEPLLVLDDQTSVARGLTTGLPISVLLWLAIIAAAFRLE